MPHLHIEISDDITLDDGAELLEKLNHALVKTQVFQTIDIKSRIYRPSASLVGLPENAQGFVFAKLALLSGRDGATKDKLAHAILDVLKAQFGEGVQYGVAIEDLPTPYLKA